MKLDNDLSTQVQKLAQELDRSPEAILRDAIEQYSERELKHPAHEPSGHPSGKPWPQRSPVGGIITPV